MYSDRRIGLMMPSGSGGDEGVKPGGGSSTGSKDAKGQGKGGGGGD